MDMLISGRLHLLPTLGLVSRKGDSRPSLTSGP
jgi:hypothetical protein